MTDDLRTRAARAADRYARQGTPTWGNFVAGYLAHAAQQPTREQIARAIYNVDPITAFLREGRVVYTWEEAPDAIRSACLRAAAAVLALLNGAGS